MVGARVLIAVRHPVISDALGSILEVNGFDVVGRISQARDAVAQAQLLKPDVILLDSQLPFEAGSALIDQLRSACPEVSIVILTDGEARGAATPAVGDGVAGIFPKEAPADQLVSFLAKLAPRREPPTPVESPPTPGPKTRWNVQVLPPLVALGLLAINVGIVWPLFGGGYTQFTGSIESAFITDARFIADNGLFSTWNPLWYFGYPFHLFYTPALPFLAAIASTLWPALSVASGYRVISAVFFVLGPVTLFFFARYLTRRTLTALICGLGYSVLPSIMYLVPRYHDDSISFASAPWQLVVMVKYGEGPHISSLTIIPLAGLFFLRALRRPSLPSYVLAGAAIAAVALTNWIGLFGLAVILAALLLSETLVSEPSTKLARAFWCVLVAFALSAFWYNLSFMRASLEFGGASGLVSGAPTLAIVGGAVLVYALFILFSGKPQIQAEVAVGLWLLLFGIIVLGEMVGIRVAPQPNRYAPELGMAAMLAVAMILTRIHDLLAAAFANRSRIAKTSIFVSATVACFVLISLPFLRQGRFPLLPNEDFQSTSEYRVAQWLAANGEGQQAYLTGSHAFWLNVETNVPQLRGGTDQGATNRWWSHVSYQIDKGKDGEVAVLWLRAMGIRWLVLNYPDSTDAYKDYAFPQKFDGLLARRYFERGTAILEAPLDVPGLAQLVDLEQLSELQVIRNAVDKVHLADYVEVVESARDSPPVSYRWPSTNRIEIDANSKVGQALLVRTTYDEGWQAYVDGQRASITPDVLGFMVIHLPAPGHHHVRLEHVRGLDEIVGYAITALALMFLMGYGIAHWVRRGLNAHGRALFGRITLPSVGQRATTKPKSVTRDERHERRDTPPHGDTETSRRARPKSEGFAIHFPGSRAIFLAAREFGALVLLVGFSAYLARDLFSGEFLVIGYSDWTYHAYRIKSLQEHGFLTWSNDWSGGFPIWNSYQFVPHLASLAVVSLTGWSITKVMVLITGILFVALRPIVYCGLRLSGLSTSAALVGAILTLPIVGYYGPLSEFSLLWGVTFFPIIIFLLGRRGGTRRNIYAAALLIGFGAYIHPIVAVIGTVALGCRLAIGRDLSRREAAYALGIEILAASFYWFPTLFGDKPAFTTATLLSYDLRMGDLLLPWFGLSPSLILVGLLTVVLAAWGFPLSRANPRLFFAAVCTLGLLLFIIIAAYVGLAPRLVNLAMPSRWMTFVGILLAISGAFVIQAIGSRWHARIILVAVVAAVGVDSLQVVGQAMPRVLSQLPKSELVRFLSEDARISYADRIVSTSGVVPEISYFLFGKARLAGNYFGQGAVDILYPPATWLLFDENGMMHSKDPAKALAYMKSMGGTSLLVPEGEPLARALLPGGTLEGLFPLRARSRGYALFRAPYRLSQAFVTPAATAKELVFPNAKYDSDEEIKLRDQLVLRFSNAIDATDTIIPQVTYPTQESIRITASGIRKGSYLIPFTPYDKGWEVRVNGQARNVERAGPHYIGVDISDFEGPIEVELTHRMHWTWKVGIALTVLSPLLCAILMLRASKRKVLEQPA